MATDVIMPALGVAQETGTLLNWLKTEGQSVTKGEPLMEVETDKATVEIEAPASGILAAVTASPGDDVPVGNRIAVILAPGEKLHDKSRAPAAARVDGVSVQAAAPARTERVPETRVPRSAKIKASPAARRIAREQGLDLSAVRGTGPEGAVLAEDVLHSIVEPPTAATRAPRIQETVQLTPMRRIVGERMTKSKQSAPHFYLSMDTDMTEIIRQRSALKERRESVVPSINDFIISASARALKQSPSVNAAFNDRGIQIYSDINIGIAVALDEGLVVPVIRNADHLSLQELAKVSRELAEKAQNKKLFPLDYEGGTFTISNLGMFGVDSFVAIINPPQCAILAVGQVAPRVVAHKQGIAVRPTMTMSLSADHRVIDGAMAARFLQHVKTVLEVGEF
jgi:pyruvate dehydrogenase E2 component (dihydrolipoyllysine-residue acetyltransferase)